MFNNLLSFLGIYNESTYTYKELAEISIRTDSRPIYRQSNRVAFHKESDSSDRQSNKDIK